jgi:DNA-binding MarR family transcriptional regulator
MTSLTATALSTPELGAWRGMLAAHSSTIAALDAELEAEFDLPLRSYEVLLHLHDAPDRSLRMGELAERLYFSRSGLTRLVDRLVNAGLVERADCPSDRRGSYAQLTTKGCKRFEAARPAHLRGVRKHFLSKLSEGDLERLSRIWSKVMDRPR